MKILEQEEQSISLPEPILVIGSSSLVGSRFVEMTCLGSEVYGAGRTNIWQGTNYLRGFFIFDIEHAVKAIDLIKKFPGKYVLNFAAETNVGRVEKGKPYDLSIDHLLTNDPAYRLNVLGPRNLARACFEFGKILIHISTDFIFEGKNGPYDEDAKRADSPDQVSWYGWTKLLGEQEVANSGSEYLIIRISYPYRKEFNGKGDVARNYLAYFDKNNSQNLYPAFADQIFTPTYIDDLAPAVLFLMSKDARGIYHLASSRETDFRTFLCELIRIARGVENPEELIPEGSIDEYFAKNPTASKWPKNGGLKVNKITKLGFTPTNWKDGIKIYAD